MLTIIASLAAAHSFMQAAPAATEAPIVPEARALMADYCQDLSSGDRAGIAARYERRGAWIVGRGTKRLHSYDFLRDGHLTT